MPKSSLLTLWEGSLQSIKIFFTAFTLLVFLTCCEKTSDPLPSHDRRALEEFFELLIKDKDFAYTLFGTKPVSIVDYFGNHPTSFETLILERGWATWQKQKHLFPSKNFELIHINFGRLNGRNHKEIVLVNKSATLNIIKKNINIFHDFLQNDWTAEDILNAITTDNLFLKNLIYKSDILGILLGYGNINAQNFEKSKELSAHINEETNPPLLENFEGLGTMGQLFVKGYGKSELKPLHKLSLDLSTSKEELNQLIEALEPFELDKSDFLLDRIQTVTFSGDMNDEETKQLKQNYNETRNGIIKTYDNKSIFEVSMNQWMKH
jgi:hypothetical protein